MDKMLERIDFLFRNNKEFKTNHAKKTYLKRWFRCDKKTLKEALADLVSYFVTVAGNDVVSMVFSYDDINGQTIVIDNAGEVPSNAKNVKVKFTFADTDKLERICDVESVNFEGTVTMTNTDTSSTQTISFSESDSFKTVSYTIFVDDEQTVSLVLTTSIDDYWDTYYYYIEDNTADTNVTTHDLYYYTGKKMVAITDTTKISNKYKTIYADLAFETDYELDAVTVDGTAVTTGTKDSYVSIPVEGIYGTYAIAITAKTV